MPKSEDQWEYVTCTKTHGRVYKKGDAYKYIDPGLDAMDNLIDQINKTTEEYQRITAKLKSQGIDRFIKEAKCLTK